MAPSFTDLKAKASKATSAGIGKIQTIKDRNTSVPMKKTNWDPHSGTPPPPPPPRINSYSKPTLAALPPPPSRNASSTGSTTNLSRTSSHLSSPSSSPAPPLPSRSPSIPPPPLPNRTSTLPPPPLPNRKPSTSPVASNWNTQSSPPSAPFAPAPAPPPPPAPPTPPPGRSISQGPVHASSFTARLPSVQSTTPPPPVVKTTKPTTFSHPFSPLGPTSSKAPQAARPAFSSLAPSTSSVSPTVSHPELSGTDEIDWTNLSPEDKQVFFSWLDEFFSRLLGIDIPPRSAGVLPTAGASPSADSNPPPVRLTTKPTGWSQA